MTETEKEIVVKHITESLQDSIEIGTPSKGGCIKIYGDFNKLDDFKAKVLNAVELRKMADYHLNE